MSNVRARAFERADEVPEDTFFYAADLKWCPHYGCGWWSLSQLRHYVERCYAYSVIYAGCAKRFDLSLSTTPIEILRYELARTPRLVHGLHHSSFERLMEQCIRDKFPGSTVRHVGRTGDGGIDLYAVIDDEPCLIQVKRRIRPVRTEGPAVVRELKGVLVREGVWRGIVVTTANHFTASARAELANKLPLSKPLVIDLIDYHGVIELLERRATVGRSMEFVSMC